MNEYSGLTSDEPGVAGPGPAGRQRWRTIVAVLLIVLGCVLAPLAGVAVWARNQVTNTDRYVRTVAPLASDPAIQTAVADQITAQVFTYLDVQGLTNQAVDALAEQGVRPSSLTSSAGSLGRWPADPSQSTIRRTAVAEGSGDGFPHSRADGPPVAGGKHDDRGLCWWVHRHSGRGANMTAPLDRQRWGEPEQMDGRGRLPRRDADDPGRPARGTSAGATLSTPARSGDLR